MENTQLVTENREPEKKKKGSKLKYVITACAAFAAGIIITLAVSSAMHGAAVPPGNGGKIDQNKINILQGMVDKYYKGDSYKKEDLVENAYRGYIAGLGDPYSGYMSANEYQNYMASTEGEYSGIGITFQENGDGSFVVVSVSSGSPAERAGFKPDDILLTVDGKTYDDIDLMAASIRGKEGTEVELTYIHDGKEKTAKLKREKIVQHSVESEMLDGNIGLIRITSFISSTAGDFDKALKEMEAKKPAGLILDLRDNGGGLVNDCVSVADAFLDEGPVCYLQDKEGNMDSYTAKDGKTDLKTVVLVNGNSASASEILAYAMKDNGYQIVGEKTFGKGVIQVPFPLEDGSALKLTVLEYLSPDKHQVHKKGVEPDVEVEDDENTEQDEQIEKAEELLK